MSLVGGPFKPQSYLIEICTHYTYRDSQLRVCVKLIFIIFKFENKQSTILPPKRIVINPLGTKHDYSRFNPVL